MTWPGGAPMQDAPGCARPATALERRPPPQRRRRPAQPNRGPVLRAPTDALEDLARRLRESSSATRVLAAWCAERGIGEGPIRAQRHPALPAIPEMAGVAARLGADPAEPLRHRRVTLWRGTAALSDCDLWWRPTQLAPAMQAELDATDRPFGLVVAALRPMRRTLSETLLPAGGMHVLDHGALLLAGTPEPRAFALVREQYRRLLVEER